MAADELKADPVDDAQGQRSEVNFRVSVVGFHESYDLVYQCLADEDQRALPPDLAVAADPAEIEVGGQGWILEPCRIDPRRPAGGLARRSRAGGVARRR